MTSPDFGRHTRQYLAIAASTLGLLFGPAIVAAAEPTGPGPDSPEWDIDAYDDCVALGSRNVLSCCLDSGGVPVGPPFDDPDHSCQAPKAQSQQTGPTRSPEQIVSGPVNEFNVPDASVPDAPVIVLPTP